MCGDSTVAADVERLLGGTKVDSIVTDPPYSSGGFQKSGRSAGSKGTVAVDNPIRNDRLSTRGYQALIKGTLALGAEKLGHWGGGIVYHWHDD